MDQGTLTFRGPFIEKEIYDRIFLALKQTAEIIFPLSEKTQLVHKKHSWLNKQVLGEVNGKPNEWLDGVSN